MDFTVLCRAGALFIGALLAGAFLDAARFATVRFEATCLVDARFVAADFVAADFVAADFVERRLADAPLERALARSDESRLEPARFGGTPPPLALALFDFALGTERLGMSAQHLPQPG
jgi:uncharacterized protein YjbI with pentapeptide repeats